MSYTGENETDLRKIMDMTRYAGIFVLLLNFYYYCFAAFKGWGLTSTITDRLLFNISQTGLFKHIYISKLIALGLLLISLLGSQGRKDEKLHWKPIMALLCSGLTLYFDSSVIFYLDGTVVMVTVLYIIVTAVGFLLILSGGALLSRLIKVKMAGDIFNEMNESKTY